MLCCLSCACAHATNCRGAFNYTYVTALGPSPNCTNSCRSFKGADKCGGDYAISLFNLTTVQNDMGLGVSLQGDAVNLVQQHSTLRVDCWLLACALPAAQADA